MTRCTRLLVLVAIVGGAEAAGAEPCAVRVDAPDDAREAIAAWMADEPTCGPPLVVHVVPGDGAFEVTASDATGRQFARVASDVQTVAALVASWAADDEMAPPAIAQAARSRSRGPRIAISATLGRGYGARIDADVLVWGHWIVGLTVGAQVGSFATDDISGIEPPGPNEIDVDAMATISYEHALVLGWSGRLTAGAGIQASYLHDADCSCDYIDGFDDNSQPTILFAMQGSLTLSHALVGRLDVLLGAMVTVLPYHSVATVDVDSYGYDPQRLYHVSPAGLVGTGYRW